MIRLYWFDAFQSVYLSEPTTAFLNLLIPLLYSQSFHHSNHSSWTSALILSESRIALACFKLLFGLWILWFRGVVQASLQFVFWTDSFLILWYFRCQSRLFLTVHRSSQLPQSCTRRHPGHKMDNTIAAQGLEMSGCRLLMGNQWQPHELLNSSGHTLWLAVHELL